MSLARHVGFIGKTVLLWVIVAVALLCILLGALGFFTVAFLIWLDHIIGSAGAAAVTGLVLVLVAFLLGGVAWVMLHRMQAKRPKSIMGDVNLLSLVVRLTSVLVRRSPRFTVLAALIAGAVAEYFSAAHKKDSQN